MEEQKLNLTMRAILMYEKLSGSKFYSINGVEDTPLFMYCIFVCSTGLKVTRNVFNTMLEGKKFARWIEREFLELSAFCSQFVSSGQKEENNSADQENVEFSLTEAINSLIFDYGLDMDYVLNKMEPWEIELYFKGAVEHYHKDMEDKRLWAYLNFLPNVDKKHSKNMTIEKFMPFPWTEDQHKKQVEKELEKETKAAKKIIGMKFSL
jgi:hypothetical protein